MDQFVVPQFIDVESKIIGPITTKQFVIMIVWGLMTFITYKLLDIAAFALFFIFWTGIMGLFGFYKVNGRPFYIFLMILMQGQKKPSLRVWRHEVSMDSLKAQRAAQEGKSTKAPVRPQIFQSRLSELSLIVDTGGMYGGKDNEDKN